MKMLVFLSWLWHCCVSTDTSG